MLTYIYAGQRVYGYAFGTYVNVISTLRRDDPRTHMDGSGASHVGTYASITGVVDRVDKTP